MSEARIQAEVMRAVGALPGVRIFRNTVGEGWQGRVARHVGECVLLEGARYVRFGLLPGSPDLIGWRTERIAGGDVARFLGLEVKTPTGVVSPEQVKFLAALRAAGAVSGVVRNPADAISILTR